VVIVALDDAERRRVNFSFHPILDLYRIRLLLLLLLAMLNVACRRTRVYRAVQKKVQHLGYRNVTES